MTAPVYPDWLRKPYSENAHNFATTLGRIRGYVAADKALEREKNDALAWCRANGNPHRTIASVMGEG